MANQCPSIVRGCQVRFTALDECGVPVPESEPFSRISSDAYVSLNFSPDVEEGEEIEIKNLKGEICVYEKACDILKGYDVDIELCGTPLHLITMLTGSTGLVDPANPDTVTGMWIPDQVDQEACNRSFAMEVWARSAKQGSCSDANPCPYIVMLWPRVYDFQFSNDISFSDGENFSWSLSARAESNDNMNTSPVGTLWDPFLTEIQEGGTWGWQCTSDLPDTDNCDWTDPV